MTMRVLMAFLFVAIAAHTVTSAGVAARVESKMRKNPIRKVVVMLQDMQKSVQEEADKEEELYSKFACYCKTETQNLDDSVSAGKDSISKFSEETSSQAAVKKQLQQEVEGHKADREEAERQVKEAA